MVHAFDHYWNDEKPWTKCDFHKQWCAAAKRGIEDRRSASLTLPGEHATFGGKVATGFVLSSEHNMLLCSYSGDGSIDIKKCWPQGRNQYGCIPGCHQIGVNSAPEWCNPPSTGLSMGTGRCAWKPTDLKVMLELAKSSGGEGYNEVVLDEGVFHKNLPSSVEAFFYYYDETTFGREKKTEDAERLKTIRAQHAHFLEDFGLDASVVPLLRQLPSGNFELDAHDVDGVDS